MTLTELQAEREKLLGALSAPESVSSSHGASSRSLRNRSPEQIRAAVAQIDGEIAKLQTEQPRQFVIQTKRGLE